MSGVTKLFSAAGKYETKRSQLEEAKIATAVKQDDLDAMAQLQKVRHMQELHLQRLREMHEKFILQLKIDEDEHIQEMQQDRESFELVKQENVSSSGSPSRMRYYENGDRSYR